MSSGSLEAVSFNWHKKRLRAAVVAERERCAGIAEKFSRSCGSVNGREAAADIAKLILELEQPSTGGEK